MNDSKATSIEALEARTLLTTVVGLTPANELVVFDSDAPEVIVARTSVMMPKGETLIGIDFDYLSRLYGLSDANRTYQIDPETGVAIAASEATIPAASGDRLSFDIDLRNPEATFRAVGKSDRQFSGPLRAPAEAAVVGYGPEDIAFGQSPDLVSLASTSDGTFPGPTTVYAIDANSDSLVTIGTVDGSRRPADTGRLYTIGLLGIDAGANASLDITTDRAAFASFSTKHGTRFCTIDLAHGGASRVGTIGDPATLRVTDIAVYPQFNPSATVLGLTSGNALLVFSSERPSVILGRTAITGLRSDEAMISVDMRPGAGELFGVSSRDVLYQIDLATGAATPIGARFTPFFKGAPVVADFNPVTGTLNVVSSLGEALRLDATTGSVVDARPMVRGIQIDAPLAYASGDTNALATPSVVTIAHDHNGSGARTSTLFGIDPVTQALVEFSGSGTDQLTTRTNLGGLIADIASLDILRKSVSDVAYLAVRTPSQRPVTLFQIDLQTGARVGLGDIASGRKPVRDIAVVTR
ncbi:MAG: hypothetical protein JWN40_2797 [Phycisphaerales bacterium]|nr:hypothetical protein [Phycisphaerales bacterium]